MKQAFLAIFLLFILTIVGAGWWFWRDMQTQLHAPLNLAADIDFTIAPGMSLQAVCRELHRTELMPRAYYLLLEARRQNKQGQLQAGEYLIKQGTTPLQLLDQFVSGKVKQYALTLIEGWTFAQVMGAIKNNGHLLQDLTTTDNAQLMPALGLKEHNPEGLFFPDTYLFPGNTTDIEVLRKAYARMQQILDEEWQQRADGLPYNSTYEALIMASLVEKETGLDEERPMIAGVFVRRMQKGMPLQTDPTIIYALRDKFDGNLRKQDMVINSPYNTYINTGLPPTPIAIAGRGSIHAALHPDDGNALYFVAKGGGAHHFSDTLSEHNKAVSKYQLGNHDNE
jgi:UPF0755 protein